jgi:hypothetical protein
MDILKAFDLNSKILRKIENFDREDYLFIYFMVLFWLGVKFHEKIIIKCNFND